MRTPTKNIGIFSKKGGVGKSATSLLLYEALRQVGKVVALNDWDPQGTSTKALKFINPDHQNPEHPEIRIWDTPPTLEHTATAVAARNADIAVVLTSPSIADGWEAEETVQFVSSRSDKAIVRVICNKFRKGTILSRMMDATAQGLSVPVLTTTINERECYKHFVAQGWKGLDSAAREEVLQLALALLSIDRKEVAA